MSGSNSRWDLYALCDLLGSHRQGCNDGLGEALTWLRLHAPNSLACRELGEALTLLATARSKLTLLADPLAQVARVLEGDDGTDKVVAALGADEPDPWLDAPFTPEEADAVAKAGGGKTPW
jgi:hypothetical protein